jgi:hypothetical protein
LNIGSRDTIILEHWIKGHKFSRDCQNQTKYVKKYPKKTQSYSVYWKEMKFMTYEFWQITERTEYLVLEPLTENLTKPESVFNMLYREIIQGMKTKTNKIQYLHPKYSHI